MVRQKTWKTSLLDLEQIRHGLQQAVVNHPDGLLLDTNGWNDAYGKYELLAGWGNLGSVQITAGDQDWKPAIRSFTRRAETFHLFRCNYEFRHSIESGGSRHKDERALHGLYVWRPAVVVRVEDGTLTIMVQGGKKGPSTVFNDLLRTAETGGHESCTLAPCQYREDYIDAVQQMLQHIHRGDIYEANYCTEFAGTAAIDPLQVYRKLCKAIQPPMSALGRWNDDLLISASPERYLAKRGNRIISQPIKGTAARYADPDQDKASAVALEASQKERSENVMIVDLVRNDLSRTAQKGSVQVPRLLESVPFSQVHHLVSTVTSALREDKDLWDVLETTFPMGSMTGAPKISAMQIIDALEQQSRKLYSGTVGYLDVDGDWDSSVIIRSALYNQSTQRVSVSVGSAITAASDPAAEYDECLLKAGALQRALS